MSRNRPTIQARQELFMAAKKKAEEIRVQVRKQHAASLKRGKYEKHSIELEEVRFYLDALSSWISSVLPLPSSRISTMAYVCREIRRLA